LIDQAWGVKSFQLLFSATLLPNCRNLDQNTARNLSYHESGT